MNTMFTGQISMIILGEMRTVTDETLATYGDGRRGNRKNEVIMNEGKRERLVLKFTRCPILDCEKKEDLKKRRCEWKVSTPSSIQTNTVNTNVEENKSGVAVNRPRSADDEKLVTIVDVSDPWSVIKEGEIRKLKVNRTAGLRLSSKTEKKATYLTPSKTDLANTKVFKKEEVLEKSLFVLDHKHSSFKKPKNSFNNYKAGLKRLRKCTKKSQTSKGIQKKVLSKPLFVVGKKTSLKNPKNCFKVYRAYKAELKRCNNNQDIKQNEISKNFPIKKARKRL